MEYRTHKIPEEYLMYLHPGWLFPRSFMDLDKCGAWFNPEYKCSLDKLKHAYETICATDLDTLIASMNHDEQFYLNDIADD